ncbi:hypothetical protein EVG20_g4040 [Dentipellis fragilis]|uniref:Ubiquitin-like domain-containing protein n=1 Tax=Dentipellis fragilis TaxID=205917 RepID=A0A4Y9YX49_9AGAM|nr:hypothetical protein EVG20_g4040 [Dentipellis fragilis]
MCESCRDRYRGYGNTKRVKWKRERESAMAELDRMRETEDRRRADAGLPQPISELPPAERRAWEGNVILGMPPSSEPDSTDSTLPVRMCTVSHCHAVLPTNYEFRRCEQHRLQNRHHSKLKRVRDKESKLVPIFDDRRQSSQLYGDGDDDGEMRERSEIPSEADDERPSILGIPPAARGLRRSNHVCTIKWCHNLLDPSSPWKMCEAHREKDRAQRRRKAERDREKQRAQEESGGMVFVNTTSTREGSTIVGDVDGQEATYREETLETGDQDTFERVGSVEQQSVVFMDPLLPPEFECPEPQTPGPSQDTMPMVPLVEDISAQDTQSTSAPPKKRMRLNNDQPIKRRLKAIKVPEKAIITAAAAAASPDFTANDAGSGSSAAVATPDPSSSTTPEVDPQQEFESASRPPSTAPTQPSTPVPVASAPASASTPAPAASPRSNSRSRPTLHMSYPLAQPPFYTPSPFPMPYPFPAFQPSPFAPPPPGFMYPAPGAWGMFGAAGLGVMGGGPNAEAPRTAPTDLTRPHAQPEAKKRKRASRAKEKDSGLKIVMVAPGPSHPSPPPMGSLADPSGMVQETTFHWVEPKHPPVPVGPPSPPTALTPPPVSVPTPALVPIPTSTSALAPVVVASRAPATFPAIASITVPASAPALVPAASLTPATVRLLSYDTDIDADADMPASVAHMRRLGLSPYDPRGRAGHDLRALQSPYQETAGEGEDEASPGAEESSWREERHGYVFDFIVSRLACYLPAVRPPAKPPHPPSIDTAMPAVAFTIGSFGDILALGGIASAVAKTIRGCASAPAEYQEFIAEVKSFARMLDQIERLCADHIGPSSRTNETPSGLLDEISTGYELLNYIYPKINAYEASLGKGVAGKNSWIDKVTWSLLRLPDVVQWRAGQAICRGNLQTYMLILQARAVDCLTKVAEEERMSLLRVVRTLEERPASLGYPWERGQSIELVDFLNIPILIPTQFCKTWDEFDNFLKYYFCRKESSRAGHELVVGNHYSITSKTGSDLTGPAQWRSMAETQIFMNAILMVPTTKTSNATPAAFVSWAQSPTRKVEITHCGIWSRTVEKARDGRISSPSRSSGDEGRDEIIRFLCRIQWEAHQHTWQDSVRAPYDQHPQDPVRALYSLLQALGETTHGVEWSFFQSGVTHYEVRCQFYGPQMRWLGLSPYDPRGRAGALQGPHQEMEGEGKDEASPGAEESSWREDKRSC